MKQKLISLVASVMLAVGVFAISAADPIPATATGNCGIAFVTFYSNSGGGSNPRKFCYGVNDVDISSESPSLIMGPLSDGTYNNDYDTISINSSIHSLFFGGPTAARLCVFYDLNYVRVLVNTTVKGQNMDANLQYASSFAIISTSQSC